jgi:alpha-beta hydrolase superfamily lysophospholipase
MRRAIVTFVLVVVASVASAASDPAKTGRLAVGVVTVDAVDPSRGDRTLATEIWYPARSEGRETEPLPRAYPLVLMAHGFCGSRLNYEYLTTHLASWGFVVAAPDFTGLTHDDCAPGPPSGSPDDWGPDLSFVCRTLHDTGGPLAKYARHVRGFATGLVGHSLGGFGVVEAAKIDQAFTAVVPLAPAVAADAAPPLATLPQHPAWMVMGGTADQLVSFTDWTEPFFEGLRVPSFLVRITDGTHGGFSDSDSHLTADALAHQQTIVKRYATAFLFRYLAHKAKFAKRLRAFDDGSVQLRSRPR